MNSNESKDTEKYFNPNEYATAWVNGTGFNLQNQELSDWIQQLQELDPAHSNYQTVLKKLKRSIRLVTCWKFVPYRVRMPLPRRP